MPERPGPYPQGERIEPFNAILFGELPPTTHYHNPSYLFVVMQRRSSSLGIKQDA